MPVYNCPLTDKSTRDCMQALFSPFLTPRESTTANNNNNGSPLPQMPPAASISSPILQSPSTSSSTSTPTSQRPISDTKTEEEQQQPVSINEHPNGAMDESAQGEQEENVDGVDHHLHGENGMYSCVGIECHQV